MKKLSLLIVALTLLTAYSCRPKTRPGTENVFVYTLEPAPVRTAQDAGKLVEQFIGAGRDLSNLYKSDDSTVYYVSKDDVTETLENDLNTGNFTFNRGMRGYLGDYAPQLPAKDEALRLAEEFLSKNGLLPRNRNELTLVHFGGLRASSVIDGKKAGPVIDKLVTVTYGRKIDDLPVVGPGSKVVVNLGNKGEVMGAIYRWRELNAGSRRQVQTEEVVSQQEAEASAKRQIISEYGQETSYRVLGSSKAYYDNNGKFLQPVYVFETEIRLKDEKAAPFNYLCVIPLLKNSPEPLNLTALDPRAKELIRELKRGEKPPQTGEKKPID